jgi:hypothetical protein
MFRNSTISCSGSTLEHTNKRLNDDEVATLCGDLEVYYNQTINVPDLCYFSLGYNHSALGLPTREGSVTSDPGLLVYNTRYLMNSGFLVDPVSGETKEVAPSQPKLIHELFVDTAGRMFVDGQAEYESGYVPERRAQEVRTGKINSYSGGLRVDLSCPRAKRFHYRIERPKVIFNNRTNQFVMWMHVDDTYQSRRMAGVASSPQASGPFQFEFTQLPDGNETVDMTLLQPVYGQAPAFLLRTYFASTAFLLPLPLMQPIWESVQSNQGLIDFRLNFQRAVYDAGYDNPDDIFRQRWRMEDVPWRIKSGNWTETYFQSNKTFLLVNSETGQAFNYEGKDRDLSLAKAINDPFALLEFSGQAQKVIMTRFVNPDDPKNSYWSPDSVAAVKAQPWTENYEDKNIMDNPVHPTVADLLIGPHRKVMYRRTKYLAISRLDSAFKRTTGNLRVIEGELANSQDLISLSTTDVGNIFGWESGNLNQSTFPRDITGESDFGFVRQEDFYDRHHQFSNGFNDRADDFRNFRDRQTSSRCPEIHHRAMAKHSECEDILNSELEYTDSEPALTAFDVLDNFARRGDIGTHSFFRAMDTSRYENCLEQHSTLLASYQACVHSNAPDFDALPLWKPGDRECVGGGGACGPPASGEPPKVKYGFTNSYTHTRQYGTMTNVYGDGGRPFNSMPAPRRASYSRPPGLQILSPKAQEFGAYERSTPWQ